MGTDGSFDHVTIAVFDVDEAVAFFGVLGFEVTKSVPISGATMDAYMGIAGMEADHVTLVGPGRRAAPGGAAPALPSTGAPRRPQLRRPRRHGPQPRVFPGRGPRRNRGGVRAAGFPTRNQPMDFHDRKLVFLVGPANVVVELAEWH